MRILETRVYRGPNLYALWPMIRLRVNLGELEQYPTVKLPGFADRLLELIPSLHEHTCGLGVCGGLVQRMKEDEGTWMGHVLEHIAIELQNLAGAKVSFGKTRGEGLPEGQYHVVYSYVEEAVGLEAGRLALRLIRHLLPLERQDHDPSPFDFQAELEAFIRLAQRRSLGPSTRALVAAAEERGIPWIRLYEGSLIQLGHGKYQRRIQATMTSESRHIATEIASDKRLTRQILDDLGLPVPRQVVVYDADEAVAEAGRLGFPVVVKPLDGNHGKAVSTNLKTADQVREAYRQAERFGSRVIVEAFLAGNDYRILVVDGKVVATAQRVPGHVVGDGGTAIDKTDAVHYEVRSMAERAVRAIGLDVAGVDYVTPDISRSYKDVGGGIVEINAAPGFRMHLAPTEGKPRDVAGPVIDMLFPRGTPSRIPIAAITGTNGKTTTTRMVGHILKLAGHHVGMATTDGVYIDGVLTVRGDMAGPWSSQLVLRDPTVDAAVLETAHGGIVRSGLGWRQCNVGAVLNVSSDHLGVGGIQSLDELAQVKRIVVEVAQDFCVLNADDERVAAMAGHSPGEPIYVTMDCHNERVRRHVRERGRAVSLEPGLNGRLLVLYQGEEQVSLLWARQIPATMEGKAVHNIQNAMFAAAIAAGLGVDYEDIRQGLRTFSDDFFQARKDEPEPVLERRGSGRPVPFESRLAS